VFADDRPVGPDRQVHERRLSGTVLVAAQEDGQLAGHPILVDVAEARH
jgi:hypothetical protein